MARNSKKGRSAERGRPVDAAIKEQISRGLEEKGGAEAARPSRPRRGPTGGKSVRGMLGLVSRREVLAFCQELALLLESGMPLLNGLNILADRSSNVTLGRIIADIADAVEEGRSFSDALAQHKRFFGAPVINMIRAGERSGKLAYILNRVALEGERLVASRRHMMGALVYPAMVIVAAILVIGVVFGMLAESFFTTFSELGIELPWTMLSLLTVGEWFRSGAFWTGIVIVMVVVVVGYLLAMRTFVFRLLRDRFLIRFPGVRHFVKQDLLITFARVFSTMLNSGVPLPDALEATLETADNEVLRLTIERVQDAVQRGERITGPLERGGVFPVLAYDLCAVGEEAGALDHVFARMAEVYEDRQATDTALLGRLIQPAIVAILALIVAFIMFAFFHTYASAFTQIQV